MRRAWPISRFDPDFRLRFLGYPLHCKWIMEDELAILAEELGLTIEQLTAEIEASCQAIEAEARAEQLE